MSGLSREQRQVVERRALEARGIDARSYFAGKLTGAEKARAREALAALRADGDAAATEAANVPHLGHHRHRRSRRR